MADINVERKRRSVWPLLLALLLVAAIAVAAWAYLRSQNDGGVSDAAPAAEVQSTPDAVTSPPPGTMGGTTDPAATPPAGTTGSTAPPPSTTGY